MIDTVEDIVEREFDGRARNVKTIGGDTNAFAITIRCLP